MIEFLDGPAVEARWLLLRRAPLYLRVTQDDNGRWDALDMLHDVPAPGERIWAYRREGPAQDAHLCFARGKGRSESGWYARARYRLVEQQPDEATLRDVWAWRTWCRAEQARAKADATPGPQEP